MVRALLDLKESDKKLPDAYDALAVAIAHAAQCGKTKTLGRSQAKSSKNWKQFAELNPDRIKS